MPKKLNKLPIFTYKFCRVAVKYFSQVRVIILNVQPMNHWAYSQ